MSHSHFPIRHAVFVVYYNIVFHVSYSSLKGITKIFKFDAKNPPQRRSTLVYLIGTNIAVFREVLDQIHSVINQPESAVDRTLDIKQYHIIVFPTILYSFEVLLEEEGLFGFVEIHRFNWDFITIDKGILSLEIPQIFQEVFIREDRSLLSSIAQSLRTMNMVSRRPSIIMTYGDNANIIADMIDRMDGPRKPANQSAERSDFRTMLIIDRNKDYPSCLLTPVVYSGLLLEIFPSHSGILHIDEQENRIKSEKMHFLKIKPKKEPSKSKDATTNLRLSEAVDNIFQENRYRHFSDVINVLSGHAKALGMEGTNIQGMQINEMHEYVAKKLPKVASQKKELFKHLILCENIVNELGGNFEQLQNLEESMLYNRNRKQTFQKIQEVLSTDGHRLNVLRHICLLYLTCTLSADETTSFMTNYLNAFGFQYLPVFSHLATAKLFPSLPTMSRTKILTNISLPKWQNQFQTEANKFKLLPTAADDTESSAAAKKPDPVCPSYVFNGSYIPLVAQLASALLSANKFDDILDKIGHTDQICMHKYMNLSKTNVRDVAAIVKRGEIADVFLSQPRTLFIFVVGGVTYAEIAACQLVEKLTGAKIVIGSNCILSGGDMMEAAFS